MEEYVHRIIHKGYIEKAPHLSVRSNFLRISDFQKGLKDSC